MNVSKGFLENRELGFNVSRGSSLRHLVHLLKNIYYLVHFLLQINGEIASVLSPGYRFEFLSEYKATPL